MYYKEPFFEKHAFALILLGACLSFALACWLGFFLSEAKCEEVGSTTGRSTQYKVLSGCYVKVEGRMIPLKAWRGEAGDL